MTTPLMPKATAVWLIDNTALTFDQIALFCGLHPLEVKGIANGDVAQGIKGMDPISSGQLTRGEIERCQEDPTSELQIADSKRDIPAGKPRKTTKYTPCQNAKNAPTLLPGWCGIMPNCAILKSPTCRHHKADHSKHSRPVALEYQQYYPDRSGNIGPVHAD